MSPSSPVDPPDRALGPLGDAPGSGDSDQGTGLGPGWAGLWRPPGDTAAVVGPRPSGDAAPVAGPYPPGDAAPVVAPRHGRVWWVVGVVALVAVVVTVTTYLVTRSASEDPSGMVGGLAGQPGLTWSYALTERGDVRPEPVGTDHALIVPEGRGPDGTIAVSMISLVEGQELWRLNLESHEGSFLTGGEIPDTDLIYLMEHRTGDQPSQLSVRRASDGGLVGERKVDDVVGVSAAGGMLFLMAFDRFLRLDPRSLGTTVWDQRHRHDDWGDGGLHIVLRDGYVQLTLGVGASPFTSLGAVVSAYAVADGSSPTWQPQGDDTVLWVDQAVVRASYREGGTLLSGLAADGSERWQHAPVEAVATSTGSTLLRGVFEGDQETVQLRWSRLDPATGEAMWPQTLMTTGDARIVQVHDHLVVVDPDRPGLMVLDRAQGQLRGQIGGEGHQTGRFVGAGDRVYEATSLRPDGRVEVDGSISGPDGLRLRAIDLSPVREAWSLDLRGPMRVLQCGTHLLAVNTDSGRIHGIG